MGTGSWSFNSPAGKTWEVPLAGTHFVCLISETREGSFSALPTPALLPRESQASALLLGQFRARDNPVVGWDSHSRRLPAALDEVLLFILTQVSPWSPGGVARAYRSQPGKEGGAVGTEAANPSSSFPGQKWGLGWNDVFAPVSSSTLRMLPAGIEHRRRDHPCIGIEPPNPAPARWFSLQPLTHLPKIPALTSWQETATGKW